MELLIGFVTTLFISLLIFRKRSPPVLHAAWAFAVHTVSPPYNHADMPSSKISPGNSAAALNAYSFRSTESPSINPRVIAASIAVVAIHVGLLAVVLTMRNEPPRLIESKTITAELISPAPPQQPAVAPVAIQSTPVPPPKPVPPKPVPKPKPVVQPRVKTAPTPLPETTAPSPVAAAAPAIGRPTMALNAPKDVAHLECNIAMLEYPALSRRRGESGTALVKFVVGLTGKIENIELKKSSGSLDDAAHGCQRASACKPYKENGVTIRAAYSQPFIRAERLARQSRQIQRTLNNTKNST